MFAITIPTSVVLAAHLITLTSAKGGKGGGGGGGYKGSGGGAYVAGSGEETSEKTKKIVGIVIGSIVGAIVLLIVVIWGYQKYKTYRAIKAYRASITRTHDLEAAKNKVESPTSIPTITIPKHEPTVPTPKPAVAAWKAVLKFVTSRRTTTQTNNLAVPQLNHDNVALLSQDGSYSPTLKAGQLSKASSSDGSSSGRNSPMRHSSEHMPTLTYMPPTGPPPRYNANRQSLQLPGSPITFPTPHFSKP